MEKDVYWKLIRIILRFAFVFIAFWAGDQVLIQN